MTSFDLGGKVAIVTGAAGDVGSSICEVLLTSGATVVAVDRSDDRLRSLADGCSMREKLVVLQGDATDEAAVTDYVTSTIEDLGGVDILCNNVGSEGDGSSIDSTSLQQFQQLLHLNATSAFLNTRAVIESMKSRRGGSIINIASISGVLGNPNDVAYTVSKHALVGLTRAAAAELGVFGIRGNAVCPGPIESSLMDQFERNEPSGASVRQWYEANTPLGRYGFTSEVATTVAFLASSASSFTTAATMMVDGGLSATARSAARLPSRSGNEQ